MREGNTTGDAFISLRKQLTVALSMTLIILLKHVSVSETNMSGFTAYIHQLR